MQFDEKVLTALEVLTDAAENDFELFRICTLVRDLIAPPKAEQVDATHQRFNGVTYVKTKEGHYSHRSGIHQAVWCYYCGDIPESTPCYVIHHGNLNKADNDISNLQLCTNAEHRRIHNQLSTGNLPPRRKEKFTCKNCGKQYTAPVTGRNKFCSTKCERDFYKDSSRYYEIRNCAYCGSQFEERRGAPQKFCSISCAAKYRVQQHKAAQSTPANDKPTNQ